MHCPKCSTYLTDDLAFCTNCGFPIQQEVDTILRPSFPATKVKTVEFTMPPGAAYDERSAPPTSRSGTKTAMIAILATLAAIAIGAALFFAGMNVNSINDQKEIVSISPTPSTSDENSNKAAIVKPKTIPSVNRKSSQTPLTTNSNSPAISSSSCIIKNAGESVNLRRDCDKKDCTTDATTIRMTVIDGTNITRRSADSQASKGFRWVAIRYNNEDLWVSDNKISCE